MKPPLVDFTISGVSYFAINLNDGKIFLSLVNMKLLVYV